MKLIFAIGFVGAAIIGFFFGSIYEFYRSREEAAAYIDKKSQELVWKIQSDISTHRQRMAQARKEIS